MSSPHGTRLALAPSEFLRAAPPEAVDDALSYLNPDAILVPSDTIGETTLGTLQQTTDAPAPVFSFATTPRAAPTQLPDAPIFLVTTLDALTDLTAADLTRDTATFIVSNLLELDIDTISLTTTLRGLSSYSDHLPDGPGTECIHISTALPHSYRHHWEDLRIAGGTTDDPTSVTVIDCRPDGRVLTRSLPRSAIGLRALDHVGPKRAQALRHAGLKTRHDVATTPLRNLLSIEGIGRRVATRIHRSATAMKHGDTLLEDAPPLPDTNPVFIDIETDGLAPTITWLIGVLDGTAADGQYTAFLQRDPTDPSGALEAFLAWYRTTVPDRHLVAYNGWDFDFPVIRTHLREYCPDALDEWDAIPRFDPYRWAVTEGNAVLPGRTNRLEDVANAIGYDRPTSGLTGAAIARTYQRWMENPTPGNEPAWEELTAYCESDVRALAAIYTALQDADRSLATARPNTPATTQQRLTEW